MTLFQTHETTRRLVETCLVSDENSSSGDEARRVEYCLDHDVFPLAYRYARERDVESYVEALGPAWRRHAMRVALLRRELARLLEMLPDDCPVTVLKGGPLAVDLFGDERLRSSADIDVLIPPSRVPSLVELAEQHGYDPATRDVPVWATNQVALDHPDRGTRIELHWRLAAPHLPVPSTSEVLERRRTIEVGDLDVPVIDPETLYLHLCYHFQQHRGFLKGLLDIAGWLDTFESEVDLESIRCRGRDIGIEGMLQWPLWTLRYWLGLEPDLLEPTADPFVHAWALWTARHLRHRYVELGPTSSLLAQWRQTGETTFDKLQSVWGKALGATVVDGARHKLSAFARPLLLGQHTLGRHLAPRTDLPLELSDLADGRPESRSRFR